MCPVFKMIFVYLFIFICCVYVQPENYTWGRVKELVKKSKLRNQSRQGLSSSSFKRSCPQLYRYVIPKTSAAIFTSSELGPDEPIINVTDKIDKDFIQSRSNLSLETQTHKANRDIWHEDAVICNLYIFGRKLGCINWKWTRSEHEQLYCDVEYDNQPSNPVIV